MACYPPAKSKAEETRCRCSRTISPSSPARLPASAAPSRSAMPARARRSCCSTSTSKAAAEAAQEIRDAGGQADEFRARCRQARRLHRGGEEGRRTGRAGLDPGQQCRHQPPQRHHRRRRRRDQGLAGHHRDQPQRRVQRDACVPRAAAREQGPHRQHRLDPVLRACADAELAGLHRLQARRARLHPRARRRTRQGRRARQRDRPRPDRDAAQRARCAPPIRNW